MAMIVAKRIKTGGRKKGTPNKSSASKLPFHLEKIYDKKPTVYLIKCHDRYKIGRTNNLSARFFTKARIFKEQRVHYEWFNLSNDQVEDIKKITCIDDVVFLTGLFKHK